MIKFATIGTSWITSSFIEAALADGRWELSCVYSRDIAKAGALLRKYRPEGGAAVNELNELARSEPDAVYIASPNSLHCGQSVFFLERGIHVICEKPAAVSERQWDTMERAAERGGALLFEAFRHINSPGFEALRTATTMIGPVRNAIMSYNQYSSKYDDYKKGGLPNVFNGEFAGGAMHDLGTYPISLAAALWGKPEKTAGVLYTLPSGADASGAMVLDYGSFLCSITFSKIADGLIENEILGEEGGVTFDKPQELSRIHLRPRAKYDAPKTKLSDYGSITAETIDLSMPMEENRMRHEALEFANIILNIQNVRPAYEKRLKISRDTQAIMDAVRKGDA